jgi:hypothetical protein
MSHRLVNGVQFALYALIVIMLLKWFGVWAGMAIYLGIVLAGSGLAWQLLSSSEIGKATWKNLTAGWLLPWTSLVGGGSLAALLIKNALASTIFGIGIAACWELNLLEPAASAGTPSGENTNWLPRVLVWLTAAGWITLLTGWIWLMKSFFSRGSEPISTLILHNRRAIPLLIPPVVLVASIGLRICGLDWLALLTVWIPLGIILAPVILMALVLIGYTLRGKPIRWN